MDLPALLDAAKRGKGSLKEIAAELGMHPNRLSDWRAGRLKPNASEIAYLAECANLPILETVADIESQLDDQHANIWKKALGNLRAAGVAATVMLTLAISSAMGYSGDAHAAGFENYPLRQEKGNFRFCATYRNFSQENARFCGRIWRFFLSNENRLR